MMRIDFFTFFFLLAAAAVAMDSRTEDSEASSVPSFEKELSNPLDTSIHLESQGAILQVRPTIIRRLKRGFSNNVGAGFDQTILGVPLKFWLIIGSIIFITAACSCNWICCCGSWRREAPSNSCEPKEEAADATKVKQKILSKSKTAPLVMNRLHGLPTIEEEFEDETSSKTFSSPV
jgi:hypothetical protein